MSIKTPSFMALAAAGVLALATSGYAQTTVTTDPVGFNTVNCLANSDTYASLPFTRPPEFVGTVASVSGNTVTVSGTTGWTANQFVYVSGSQPKTYYALIGTSSTSNPNEGRVYLVTANDSVSVTLNLNGDSISSIASGTPISLIPYWTLNTVFPASDENVSFTPSSSPISLKTQILIPDYQSSGINLAANKSYYFITSGTNVGWRLAGDSPLVDHGDDVLVPDGYIIVRNKNSAPASTLTEIGSVLTKKISIPLASQSTSKQDNFVSIVRPVDVALSNTGLDPALNNFVASANNISIKDEVLLFDNSTAILNRAASKIYYYISNGSNIGWRLAGDSPLTDHGSDLIPAGSAVIIRKAQSVAASTTFWTNSPTY